jgi:hypothetical protein
VGIVDSISAGYRFLVQRPHLLLLPLLIDAFLWLAPRLSIEPLLSQMADFYREFSAGIADAGAEFSGLADQTTQLLTVIGESSNLMELVVSRTLYHMPSLLASIPGIKSGHSSIQIESVGTAGMLALLLGLLGIMIGVIYMNMLARAVPLGEGQKSPAPGQFTDLVIRQWLRTIGFVLGVCLLLVIIYVPATVIATLLMMFSPALGSGAMLLLSGLSVVIFFYLYFVTVGLILDNLPLSQAVVRSVMLVRHNFWPTLGFVIVTGLISLGLGLLLAQLAASGPIGTLLAVPANAFIGTGLVLALLVFYRTRLLAMVEPVQSPQKHSA